MRPSMMREERFAHEKQRIAMAAADLVQQNETIGLTAGTTTTQVARGLRLRKGLHIITNAVNIGMELNSSRLGDHAYRRLHALAGGFLADRPYGDRVAANGADGQGFYRRVAGIDPERGATTIQPTRRRCFGRCAGGPSK